jgi:hypothetical protein
VPVSELNAYPNLWVPVLLTSVVRTAGLMLQFIVAPTAGKAVRQSSEQMEFAKGVFIFRRHGLGKHATPY